MMAFPTLALMLFAGLVMATLPRPCPAPRDRAALTVGCSPGDHSHFDKARQTG